MRIPKTFALEAGLQASSEIELTIRDGQIVLTPMTKRRYSLAEMVAGITDENRHPETDFGPDVGSEIVE